MSGWFKSTNRIRFSRLCFGLFVVLVYELYNCFIWSEGGYYGKTIAYTYFDVF